MKKTILAAFAFVASASLTISAQTIDNLPGVRVFDNQKSDIPYRIPALAQTKDGTLIATCDYRISFSDIGYSSNGHYAIDNVMRLSTDGGKTWGEMFTMAKGEENAGPEWRTGFGDPSIVADRTSQNVLMQCVGGKTGYWNSTRNHPQESVFFHSTDGGRTWDKGTRLTDMIYGLYDGTMPGADAAQGIFLTSGRIMQSRYVKVGKFYRLYIAHPVRTAQVGKFATYVIYSDDFGQTWQVLGGAGVKPSDAADESKVEELPDGSVLLSCRNQTGGRQFNIYTYTNPKTAEGCWGKSTMPESMKAGVINACNGEILVVPARRLSDGKKLFLALQSVPMATNRINVGFFVKELASYADYATVEAFSEGWTRGLQVSDTESCYSTMQLLKDGTIGFLYEENWDGHGGYDIVYKNFTLEKITLGKYTLDRSASTKPYVKARQAALAQK